LCRLLTRAEHSRFGPGCSFISPIALGIVYEFRRETGTYPHVEGFVNVPLDLEALKNLLALHECTHVVMPRSLTGEEYPDFIPADGFVGLLEEGVPA
jgi:hypothetical protein